MVTCAFVDTHTYTCIQGGWAVTQVEEDIEREKRTEFVQEVDSYSTDMTLLHESFVVSCNIFIYSVHTCTSSLWFY